MFREGAAGRAYFAYGPNTGATEHFNDAIPPGINADEWFIGG